MTVCNPISTCSKSLVCSTRNIRRETINRASNTIQQSSRCYYTSVKHPSLHYTTTYSSKAYSCSLINGYQFFGKKNLESSTAKHSPSFHSLAFRRLLKPRQYCNPHAEFSNGNRNMDLRPFVFKQSRISEVKRNVGPFSLKQRSLYAGVLIGLLVCFSTSQPSYAEVSEGNGKKEGYCDASYGDDSHSKNVLTDYSVIGIPGDGRCLFRSVVHGVFIRSGKPAPNENLQRELADELRDRVADEFITRRKETEWFIEGDFETYVPQIRKPHVWGGEPELLMASHVLRMPITVYMHDEDSGGLISIAEYGQEEYGKDNPIEILYHGYGHYDALHVRGKGGPRPRPRPRL